MRHEDEEIDIGSLYSREIRLNGWDRLLDPKEEIELSRRIHQGFRVIDENKPIRRDNVELTPDADEAFKELVGHNLRWVMSIAVNEYPRHSFFDTIQYGNMGLMIAALLFNPDKKCRFTTYATVWIRQQINRNNSNNEKLIRIPVHRASELYKIKQFQMEFLTSTGRMPNVNETSFLTGLSEEAIETILDAQKYFVDLNGPVKEDGETELGDMIPDESQDYDEQLLSNDEKSILMAAIDSLCNHREKIILLYRFGFLDGEQHTMEEVAELQGITRQRVEQVQNYAFKKIKKSTYWMSKLKNL